jgi:RNA polymerase sigma factor (sigma-70 family)
MPASARTDRTEDRERRLRVNWSQVYETTYEDLVRFLHRKVWDVERAQELAQETFVRALDQEPDNPRAWVFTVAANLARDEARTAIRRKKHLALLKNEAEHATAPDPGSEMDVREQVRAVKQALERLSDRDRDVLLLWDAGLSYNEISAQTGLAVGAIGTTLARARRRLADAYEELEESHAARG